MRTSRLSSKGQVVVPKAVRNALQAETGAEIEWEVQGDMAVLRVVRKKTAKPGAGYGMLKGKGRKVPLEKWDEELAKALRKAHAGN